MFKSMMPCRCLKWFLMKQHNLLWTFSLVYCIWNVNFFHTELKVLLYFNHKVSLEVFNCIEVCNQKELLSIYIVFTWFFLGTIWIFTSLYCHLKTCSCYYRSISIVWIDSPNDVEGCCKSIKITIWSRKQVLW